MIKLLTPREAAAELRCSVKILHRLVASGALRYIQVGQTKLRPRKMFTPGDLEKFIADQTRRETPLAPPQRTDRSKSTFIPFSQTMRPNAARRGA